MKQLIRIIFFLFILGIWLSSCRTQYIPIEKIKTEYKIRDSIRFDSIYQHDSVYLQIREDTVYQYKYKYLYKYQYIHKTDTLIKTDSIQVPYPVEKQLTQWQLFKQDFGGTAMLVVIIIFFVLAGQTVHKLRM